MTTMEEFVLANQVDGQLTDAQAMQLLGMQEGDSTSVQSSVPDAVQESEPDTDVEVKSVDPVIMAKDGIHTIPFEKLQEAREAEQAARALANQALQELEALRNARQPQAAQTEAETPSSDANVFGDFSEEAIAKGIEKVVAAQTAAIKAEFDAKLASALEPIQRKEVESATDSHFSTIEAAHPDVESVVPSEQFGKWMQAQPSVVRTALQAAIDSGTATEVIEVLDAYKSSTGKPAVTNGKPDVAAAAQAAIAKAKTAPPKSLSEFPASTNVVTDEAHAIGELSGTGLMNKFAGKSAEQIEALMNRLI